MNRAVVKLNNALVKTRRKKVRPGELLLLLPSCLQRSECEAKLDLDVANCERCGRCKMKQMVELAERYGVEVHLVKGGRLALEKARDEGVKAIVAVACATELRSGILAAFPKAVLGVVNERPHGPCRDTDVDVERVEAAIRFFLRESVSAREEDRRRD